MGEPDFVCLRGVYVEDVDEMLCAKSGTPIYVNCNRSIAGDPPRCACEPLDNSEEAVARRREWMEGRKNGDDEA